MIEVPVVLDQQEPNKKFIMDGEYDKRDYYLELFAKNTDDNLTKELTLYLANVYLDAEQQERLLKIILLALEKVKTND